MVAVLPNVQPLLLNVWLMLTNITPMMPVFDVMQMLVVENMNIEVHSEKRIAW